jgi:hypothetical protein
LAPTAPVVGNGIALDAIHASAYGDTEGDAGAGAYDDEGAYEDVDALLLAALFEACWGDPLAEDPEVIEVYLRR